MPNRTPRYRRLCSALGIWCAPRSWTCVVCLVMVTALAGRELSVFASDSPKSTTDDIAPSARQVLLASFEAPVDLPPVVLAVPLAPSPTPPFDSQFGAALARQPSAALNSPALIAPPTVGELASEQPGATDDGSLAFDGFDVERSREMPDDTEMSRRRRLATIRRFNRQFETLPGVWLRGTAEPNIREPGPDSFNFPNSAYAVPVGVVYLESSPFTYRRYHNSPVKTYLVPFLLRVGIFSRVELRMQGSGITTDVRLHDTLHGFSPLIFGFKHNWWEEDRDNFIPAVGLEMEFQTNLGSPHLSTPQTQPSYSLNFDHSLPFDFVFEWNIGGTYGAKTGDGRVMQFNFEYSLQGPIVDNVEMFVHGFVNEPATGTRFKDGSMVGVGGIWYVARRLSVYGSYSHGLTPSSIRLLVQLGLAVAF
ncbi:MAG: transporter [Pirellulales bacterium]|nr:transporter [Pirellulales bacterium]